MSDALNASEVDLLLTEPRRDRQDEEQVHAAITEVLPEPHRKRARVLFRELLEDFEESKNAALRARRRLAEARGLGVLD